jgi:hypothetical protein
MLVQEPRKHLPGINQPLTNQSEDSGERTVFSTVLAWLEMSTLNIYIICIHVV